MTDLTAVNLTLCRACRRSMSRVLIPHSLQQILRSRLPRALQQATRAKGEGERELINKRAIVQSSLYHNDGRTLPCLGGQSPWGDELCDGRSHNAQSETLLARADPPREEPWTAQATT
ncbi:hypothetical protein J3E69DRAFT_327597 [Trichoderma sp. SZMC 28015]